jgi:hypothetical protein
VVQAPARVASSKLEAISRRVRFWTPRGYRRRSDEPQHKLRHTFASSLFVRGEDPPYVMAQLGHTDPAFTLRVYAHAMRRDAGDKEALKALVKGRHWAAAWPMTPRGRCRRATPQTTKAPRLQGFRTMGAAGFEPATSRV